LLANFFLGTQRQIIAGDIAKFRQFVGTQGLQAQETSQDSGNEAASKGHGAMIAQPKNRHFGES